MFLQSLLKSFKVKPISIKFKLECTTKCDLKIENYQPIKLSNLDKLQLKKILKWTNISKREYEQKKLCLVAYEKLGFKVYQIIESSKHLLRDPKELARRHNLLLRVCARNNISILMLKRARNDEMLKKAVEAQQQDGANYSKMLMQLFQCSEDELSRISIRNLCGFPRKYDLISKVEMLVKNGVDIKIITNNISILNNKSYAVLERRLCKMKELNMHVPTYLGTLNRTEEDFQTIYSDLLSNESIQTFNKSIYILDTLAKRNKINFHFERKKVDLLLKKGFNEAEIIEQAQHWTLSFQHLKSLVDFSESIQAPSSYPPPLKLVLSGENNHYTQASPLLFIKPLTQLLDCKCIDRLPDMIDKQHVLNNLNFLQGHAFNFNQIRQLPFVLCYPPKFLHMAWQEMLSDARIHFPASYHCVGRLKNKRSANDLNYKAEMNEYFNVGLNNDQINPSSNLTENTSLNDDKEDEERIKLLNVLQYKLEMLPLSEVMSVRGGRELEQHLLSDHIRLAHEETCDVQEGSSFKSKAPIALYLKDEEYENNLKVGVVIEADIG